MQSVISHNNMDKAADHLKEYKVLNQPRGNLLVISDFKHLYPDHFENLFSSWPAVQRQIQQVALQSKIKDPTGTELLGYLKQSDDDADDFTLDDDCRDAVLLQLLSSLCPATARVTVGSKSFKPSVIEARDAFICHTTVGADLEPLMERRRTRMSDLHAPLQPYMILLGDNRAKVSAVYVAFDRTLYKLSCILQALDTCFKLFHTCHMNYPPEAKHLWNFFHPYVYKIKHDPELDGDVPMSTTVFISSLNSL